MTQARLVHYVGFLLSTPRCFQDFRNYVVAISSLNNLIWSVAYLFFLCQLRVLFLYLFYYEVALPRLEQIMLSFTRLALHVISFGVTYARL